MVNSSSPGIGIETGQESRGKRGPLRALQKVVVQLADQGRLVPLLHMLPQRIAQTDGGGADRFPMAGYIREHHPRNHSLAASRHVIDISTAWRRCAGDGRRPSPPIPATPPNRPPDDSRRALPDRQAGGPHPPPQSASDSPRDNGVPESPDGFKNGSQPRGFCIILSHASAPPSSGRTCVMPWDLRSSAARALEASFGQLQYRMISRSRGICLDPAMRSSVERRTAPGTEGEWSFTPARKSTM